MILGVGVDQARSDSRLPEHSEPKCPGFTFEWVESAPPHIVPYGSITAQAYNPANPHQPRSDPLVGACDVLLSAERPSEVGPLTAQYAVTTVHSVIEAELFKEVTDQPPLPNSELRPIVYSTPRRYALHYDRVVPPMSADLESPPLLSCRYFYDMTAEVLIPQTQNYLCAEGECTVKGLGECPHRYINDMVIFRINDAARQALPTITSSIGIMAADFEAIRILSEMKHTVYVRGNQYQLADPLKYVRDQQHAEGFYIAFSEVPTRDLANK